MKKRKKRRLILLLLFGLLLIFCVFELLWSNFALTVSRYTLTAEEFSSPVRVVFLADLHGRSFGSQNSRLLETIAEQQPDLIAFVGDIFDREADDQQIREMCDLLRASEKIAPVYFCMGNHEYACVTRGHTELPERIVETGAVLLDSSFVDLELGGAPVRIGGYMGYYPHPHMMTQDKARIIAERQFFTDFESTNRYKLLLNHIPTGWLDWNYINKREVDLVLSGHYHGGVVRVPFLEKGLFAPYIGWWPPYTKGLFQGTKAACVLTTGLAGSYGLPRFFNPPEICVVDLLPEMEATSQP